LRYTSVEEENTRIRTMMQEKPAVHKI
jgi:hypothetical protein